LKIRRRKKTTKAVGGGGGEPITLVPYERVSWDKN
jgi:hypothetical protein